MRKCALFTVASLSVLSFALPGRAEAQGVFLGAGATVPTGDYGDYANTGFLAVGGISFPIGAEGVSILGEGYFGQNSHDDEEGDAKTNPYGAMAGLLYEFAPDDEAGPYVFGQVGIMVHKYSSDQSEDESETGFGFGGGAGYGFPIGGVNGWIEGRYMQGQFDGYSTGFFGIVAGISLSVGGDAG